MAMKPNAVLGMVCGYFLSRFDEQAYESIGLGSQGATHKALAKSLQVPPKSIQNWRDEFDPIHGNQRQGWHKRPMIGSRLRVVEALQDTDFNELRAIIDEIVKSPNGLDAKQVIEAVQVTSNEMRVGAFALRGVTGARAETAFQSFHKSEKLPAPGLLIDRRCEQCGYDFEIKVSDGVSAFVEVKGLVGNTGGVMFTDKEWRTALDLADAYYLALVHNVGGEPKVYLVQNPAASLGATKRTYMTLQIGWSVSQGSLRKKTAKG